MKSLGEGRMPAAKKRKKPTLGKKYQRKYKKKLFEIEIVSTDGGLGYKMGKEIYPSPSAAAKAITGAEINGWVFWKIN